MSKPDQLFATRRDVLWMGAIGASPTLLPSRHKTAGFPADDEDLSINLRPFCRMITYTGDPISVGKNGLVIIPLTGGGLDGPRLNGVVLSGESWLNRRTDGNIEYLVRYIIKTDEGQLIADQAHGFINSNKGIPQKYSRTYHNFEAPEGAHEWLNEALVVGKVGPIEGGRRIDLYHLGF